MAEMKPANRPQLKRQEALEILKAAGVSGEEFPVRLLGIRGYYKKTMGNPLSNDVGIYDDAIFMISPREFQAFNANTDPSSLHPGVAVLKPGLHLYRPGLHGISKGPGKAYPALRPATPGEKVPVTRDGKDSTGIAINIHRGGYGTTSSEGCQTIYPDQYTGFIHEVYELLSLYRQKFVPYFLYQL